MNVFSSEKLTAFLARFNDRINEVCDRECKTDVHPLYFKIEMTSDGMALLSEADLSEEEGYKTQKIPIDDLPFFLESMIQALDLVEKFNFRR